MFDLFVRFQNMDRRWIFLGMAISIFVPMVAPMSCEFGVDEPVRRLWNATEELKAGDTVFLSADFDPASRPELEPYFRAVLHQLFRNDVKIVSATLWEYASPMVLPIFEEIAGAYGKTYGEDWAYLGYKPGKELAVKAIGENIPATFPKDYKGTPIGDLPVMRGFNQAKDFAMVIMVSAGFPGIKEYVLQIQGQYDLKMGGATTAVSGPDYFPYYQAGQLVGLAAGMPGAAQYEKLTWPGGAPTSGPAAGIRLSASQSINVLNLGHLFIILLIVFGNLAYFVTKERGGS